MIKSPISPWWVAPQLPHRAPQWAHHADGLLSGVPLFLPCRPSFEPFSTGARLIIMKYETHSDFFPPDRFSVHRLRQPNKAVKRPEPLSFFHISYLFFHIFHTFSTACPGPDCATD